MELTYGDDERLEAVSGIFVVDWPDWERVDAGALFHLEPNLRGPTFGGGLDPTLEVEIEAKLDDDLVPGVADTAGDDEFVVGAMLRGAGPADPMAQTERWFGMFVKQAEGPLKVGFKTSWAPF